MSRESSIEEQNPENTTNLVFLSGIAFSVCTAIYCAYKGKKSTPNQTQLLITTLKELTDLINKQQPEIDNMVTQLSSYQENMEKAVLESQNKLQAQYEAVGYPETTETTPLRPKSPEPISEMSEMKKLQSRFKNYPQLPETKPTLTMVKDTIRDRTKHHNETLSMCNLFLEKARKKLVEDTKKSDPQSHQTEPLSPTQ